MTTVAVPARRVFPGWIVVGATFILLLVSSGLLLRSAQRLFAVAPGFDAAQLLTMQVETSGRRFVQDSMTHRFFAQLLDAVGNVPGVQKAALTSQLPLSGDADLYGVHLESNDNPDDDHSAFRYAVSPGYLETMGSRSSLAACWAQAMWLERRSRC